MCNMNSPAARHRRKASKKAAKVVVSPKPARKARTRTRKPKYLSLKLELSPKIKSKMPNPEKPKNKMTHKQQKQQDQQLINLFPLHPENLVQQDNKDMHDHGHDHVAFLFESASDTSTTLHGLTTTTITTSEEEGPLIGGGHEIDHQESFGGPSLLVRTAMKCKERDLSEERWVSYWEVVEKKEQEEVSSTSSSSILGFAAAAAVDDALGKQLQEVQDDKKGLVGLKLDYQEILNVWSDKGPLYIEARESAQIVPDLYDGCSNGLMEGWGRSVGNLWRVPETGSMKIKDRTLEEAAKEGWKSGHREASVLRYKEKRQSRLFAKRIRYEVRKLNAEKRPRLKGRFVKRS